MPAPNHPSRVDNSAYNDLIDQAMSLGVLMGEERNFAGMGVVAASGFNRGNNPSAHNRATSSRLGDVFAAPQTGRALVNNILNDLNGISGLPRSPSARAYSTTMDIPKQTHDAFLATKAAVEHVVLGTPIPENLKDRFDKASVALDVAKAARAMGVDLGWGITNYGTPKAATKAGAGARAVPFGGHRIGPFEKGAHRPSQKEIAARIGAVAQIAGIPLTPQMQKEIESYTTGKGKTIGRATPEDIAAAKASLEQMPSVQDYGRVAAARARDPVDTPVEMNLAGMEASRAAARTAPDEAFRDETDVLANEQLGVPDLPGPLSLGALAPARDVPDVSMGLAYDNLTPNPIDYSDITRGILHDVPEPPAFSGLGFIGDPSQPFSGRPSTRDVDDLSRELHDFNEAAKTTALPGAGTLSDLMSRGATVPSVDQSLTPFVEDYSGITRGILHDEVPSSPVAPVQVVGPYTPAVGPQPDYSDITRGILHDEDYPSNPYGPEALGAPQTFGNYGNAPIGYSPNTFSGAPMQTQPATPDVFSGQPMGASQGFGNYSNPSIGYSPSGFSQTPNVATDMSLANLGIGPIGAGYTQAVQQSYAPEAIVGGTTRGMSFDQMTRGIVGYEDKPTTTTTQVANPAYAAWEEAYNNPKATTQEMYAGALTDKLGIDRGNFLTQDQIAAARAGLGPAPSRTTPSTKTTHERSPVYGDPVRRGDVPVGQPIGANLSGSVDYGMYPGGNWGGYAKGAGMLAGLDPNIGISGVTGSIGGGFGDPVGYGGGSFSDAYSGGYGGYSGGYGGIGAATSGNEQQGGAYGGYGGGFGGSQGSDPSGRGGLY